MGKPWYLLILLTFATLLGTGCKLRTATDNLAGSYPVQQGGKLIMRLNQGAVDLQTKDGLQAAVIHVNRKVTSLRGNPKSELASEKIDITSENGELRITSRRESNGIPHIQLGDVIDTYVIEIPRHFSVDIESGCGGIRVGSLQGSLTVSSAGDGIAVDRVEGAAEIKCSGGNIEAREITGPLIVKNAGGDIILGSALGGIDAKSSGGNIKAAFIQKGAVLKTAGGDIDIASGQDAIEAGTAGGDIHISFKESPRADCEIKTAGGDIRVQLPANASAILDAKSAAGSVTTDFPLAIQGKLESSELSGKIGEGGATLRLRTSGGDIHILTRK